MWTPRRLVIAACTAIFCAFCLICSFKLFEDVGPDEIAVIQHPVSGQLDVYTTPGIKWQGFGEVTTYKKRSNFNFEGTITSGVNGGAAVITGGIEVRFNDGGHGTMMGSVQYELPTDPDKIRLLHTKFRNQGSVQAQLVETVTTKAIYLVGPLMSSRESYSERRNDLIYFVGDQIQHGVYRTHQRQVTVTDPITNQTKTVMVAEIATASDGKPERAETSSLDEFGIRAFNFTIKRLPYDKIVEDQIRQQQQLAMDVQTSIAELRKAEQRTQTVAQQGQANAAEAKWMQETIKAKMVTEAEQNAAVAVLQAQQRLRVAELDQQAAERKKATDILLGQGESERRRLVLEADGALTQKLEAYLKVSELYANAIANYKGNWVPGIVMGGGTSANTGGSAMDFMSLLTAKAAKDLALDLNMQRGSPMVQPPR